MGCDIHIYAEVYVGDGKWVKQGAIFVNPYYDFAKPETEFNVPKIDEPYCGRNYDLFAILADVRNGRGFAGCVTGMGFTPIAMPKGLPIDVSDEIKKMSDDYGQDGHSHSFFTVKELLEYDWSEKTEHFGVVNPLEFKEYQTYGRPESYCGMVDGRNIRHVSNQMMANIIEGKTNEELATFEMKIDGEKITFYTTVKWYEFYNESAERFVTHTIPALQELGHPDNVRIVFFFDN